MVLLRHNAPFIFESIAQLKHLDLHLATAIVFEDFLVGLALAVLQAVDVFGVRRTVAVVEVARFEGGEVALDVAGCTAASRRGETDVGGHRLRCASYWCREVVYTVGARRCEVD